MRKKMVAVIGASEPRGDDIENAREAGRLIAKSGWVLVTGGLGGVMEAASRGAAEEGGTVVGILPQGSAEHANEYVDIPIATSIGYARNVVIAHTADALVAVGGGMGTLSEIAVSLKLGKPVFALGSHDVDGVVKVKGAKEAVEKISIFFS